MIESIIIFVLGFLVATLLTILFAPAIWGRAAHLTRREMEATMPLSLEEIRAETDAIRAEYAARLRRLEILNKTATENANKTRGSIAEDREKIAAFDKTIGEKERAITDMKQRIAKLESELAISEQKLENAREKAVELAERTQGYAQAEINQLRIANAALRNGSDVPDPAREAVSLEPAADHPSAASDLALAEDNAALRAQLRNLAARLTAQVAMREGPQSPIPKIVEDDPSRPEDSIESLASEIRAISAEMERDQDILHLSEDDSQKS